MKLIIFVVVVYLCLADRYEDLAKNAKEATPEEKKKQCQFCLTSRKSFNEMPEDMRQDLLTSMKRTVEKLVEKCVDDKDCAEERIDFGQAKIKNFEKALKNKNILDSDKDCILDKVCSEEHYQELVQTPSTTSEAPKLDEEDSDEQDDFKFMKIDEL